MEKKRNVGVFQCENGNWGYRYTVVVGGETRAKKKVKDENGIPFKTEKQAIRARNRAIAEEQLNAKRRTVIKRKTFSDVYKEYCETGRSGKAYSTIRKQDSLWRNHLKERFGKKYVDEITVAEITDYLSMLYYEEGRAYGYVEGLLRFFYLVFGQAYARDYLDIDTYNKLCVNKDTKIKMPKMKVDEETEIVIFSKEELKKLDGYFKGTNAETAYMIGRYCGVRINECYGIMWSNIDFEEGTIRIERQMQYQEGVIKLVSLKTRNAKRTIYMAKPLQEYLEKLYFQKEEWEEELADQRQQNQIFIEDANGKLVSCLELVNTLPNGKRQSINSMKYHANKVKEKLGIHFKYHYLRHTYGTALADKNTPPHILCNQMGHGNINVTQQYYVAVSRRAVEVLKHNLKAI
ncbi:tyrosine-type recombinase/integrase [Ihubacter sp. rT4E-8]|uniref:tyrosine-type recombinase/integrase n=1 Tax=Ihubacter sp. rT4E-8 TaxID=3242369 RepID=UPI003CE7A4BF